MNILITGAAGTVGIETIKQLLASNHQLNIIAFELNTRKTRKKLKQFSKKIKIIYGNISNPKDIARATSQIDLTIHLAAIIPPMADEKPELADKVNVGGTRNLVESLKKNSPESFIIYSSSISVYGDRINNPQIRVEDELKPSEGDYYAQTKIKAEEIIKNSGLNWSIFRLTAIFGIKNHRISPLMFHMPLETPMEIATAEDTGRAFAYAIEHLDKLKGKIFNLSGGKDCRISYKKFLSLNFKLFGLGRINFPGIAFATQNFHCAYYADGNELEKILHFRKDTIDSYFKKIRMSILPLNKFFTKLFSPIIKIILLKKSEPMQSIQKGDISKIKRFFGNKIDSKHFSKINKQNFIEAK